MPGIINKIYIDSRFRTFDSKSSSNFKIELKEYYLVLDNYGAVITDITLPRSWYTANENNNKLYLRLQKIAGGTTTDYIVTIPPKNYDINTLALALSSAITTAALPIALPFVVTADIPSGTLTISNGSASFFQILTDTDLQAAVWTGPVYDKTSPQSINNVLSNVNDNVRCTPTSPFVSGVVNVLPYESVYNTCNQLTELFCKHWSKR